jgi:pimeloyl-ACP methyl ester carboxylesterase
MPLFQHQGRTIHYAIENNAFDHDVLFVHGNLASTRWWQPTIQFLEAGRTPSKHGRLVAADWPGCGQSLAPSRPDDLSMWSLAHDHIALAKSIGMTDVCLVGHSTGGLVSLIMLLLEPELFSRTLLLDPVSAQGIQFGPDMILGFEQMSQDRKFCEVILGGTIYGRDVHDPFVQKLIDDAFGVDKMVWTEIPKFLGQIDLRKDLHKIEQPMLVLHGEHDQILPVEGSREIAKSVAHGKFEILRGRGHCANVEEPSEFAAKLTEFFL